MPLSPGVRAGERAVRRGRRKAASLSRGVCGPGCTRPGRSGAGVGALLPVHGVLRRRGHPALVRQASGRVRGVSCGCGGPCELLGVEVRRLQASVVGQVQPAKEVLVPGRGVRQARRPVAGAVLCAGRWRGLRQSSAEGLCQERREEEGPSVQALRGGAGPFCPARGPRWARWEPGAAPGGLPCPALHAARGVVLQATSGKQGDLSRAGPLPVAGLA